MTLSWPVDAPISQQFGQNPNNIQPNGHTGIDFACAIGTPIYAADSGNIVWEGWATNMAASNPWWIAPNAAGICVIINHNDGLMSVYGHLSSTTIDNGQFVEKGQLIGYSGATGLATGPHLHFEIFAWPLQPYNGYYGRLDPNGRVSGLANAGTITPQSTTKILAAYQRRVGPNNLFQRSSPNTTAPIVRVIEADTVETFTGFSWGEFFSGSNLWYKDSVGYVWSGGFTLQSTDGLPNQTPASILEPYQRQVGSAAANQRSRPSTSAPIVRTIEANSIEVFTGFAWGEFVDGQNLWYKDDLGYVWAGAFTTATTDGLPNQTPPDTTPSPEPAPAPAPTPAPEPAPAPEEKYSFTPDFDFVEVIPAALNNFQYGNFPAKPEKAVIHQFGQVGVDTVGSTVNTFTNNKLDRPVSAHFVVSGDRIIQMVSLKDRAYHAYVVGNNWVGIETDPAQDEKTIASVNKLLRALRDKFGYVLTPIRHMEVPAEVGSTKTVATNCGSLIDLSKYQIDTPPTPAPAPQPEPAPAPAPETTVTVEQAIERFQKFQRDEFLKNQ